MPSWFLSWSRVRVPWPRLATAPMVVPGWIWTVYSHRSVRVRVLSLLQAAVTVQV